MITLVNLHEFRAADYDVTYAIVRSCSTRGLCVFQKAELSPSSALYSWYLQTKEAGMWNYQTFEQIYVPRFLDEIVHNTEALKSIKFIYDMSQSGVNVAVGCYCYKEDLCHRSIIGGILLGCKAQIMCNLAYSRYFEMYIEALKYQKEPLSPIKDIREILV